MDNEVDQFLGGMQPLECRHRPNKVLERWSFPVNQGVGRDDVYDRYGNGVFADCSNLYSIGRYSMCEFRNFLPPKGYQHFKRRAEHSNDKEQEKH